MPVQASNRLASFLYEVMRDSSPPGIMEGLLEEIIQREEQAGPDMNFALTDPRLAAYAEELAHRLAVVWKTQAPLYKALSCPYCEGEFPGEHEPGCTRKTTKRVLPLDETFADPEDKSANACISHCCKTHGCKYGEENCVVATGQEKQKYECMKGPWCSEPGLFDGREG